MRHLRFAAFLSLIAFLIVLLPPTSSGQSTQATNPSLSLAQPGASSGQQPDGSWRKPAIGKVTPICDQLAVKDCVQHINRRVRPQDAVRRPNPDVDRGIFLRDAAGTETFCGSIVSYNFSPGDNPKLEGVTTCTPNGSVVTHRAKGENKTPAAPLFQTTEYSTQQQ